MNRQFLEIQKVLVPLANELDPSQQAENIRLVNLLLNGRSNSEKRLFKIFINIVYYSSYFLYFKSFQNLSSTQKLKLMDLFFDFPVGLIRKGFWGLNTICKVGIYGQSSLHSKLNYNLKAKPNG